MPERGDLDGPGRSTSSIRAAAPNASATSTSRSASRSARSRASRSTRRTSSRARRCGRSTGACRRRRRSEPDCGRRGAARRASCRLLRLRDGGDEVALFVDRCLLVVLLRVASSPPASRRCGRGARRAQRAGAAPASPAPPARGGRASSRRPAPSRVAPRSRASARCSARARRRRRRASSPCAQATLRVLVAAAVDRLAPTEPRARPQRRDSEQQALHGVPALAARAARAIVGVRRLGGFARLRRLRRAWAAAAWR